MSDHEITMNDLQERVLRLEAQLQGVMLALPVPKSSTPAFAGDMPAYVRAVMASIQEDHRLETRKAVQRTADFWVSYGSAE